MRTRIITGIALALCACTDTPVLSARAVALEIHMLLADNRAWSTKGSFALEVTHRGDADSDLADVFLAAANPP